MIQDYRLLGYNLPHNLEETVQNYIKQGYQPYGNPFVDGDHYYQAVVKYQTMEDKYPLQTVDPTIIEGKFNAQTY